MTGEERLKALLRKGYLPKELPPVFTSEDFGSFSSQIIQEWADSKEFKRTPKKLGKHKYKSGAFEYTVTSAELETISTPKRGYERRDIHITHPLPQALLTKELADNWVQVQKWLTRQTYSMDEIRLSETHPRSVKGINFALHRVKKAYIESTADWLVKTDITRFYPSIYTHSIPWAAYGKEAVKKDLKRFGGSLADRLDVLIRACNRNQTVGIPVGPETSRIIAEILSSRIDSDFFERQLNIPIESVDRLQDDWFIGLPTLESSETALASIIGVYRAYGLDINGHKTSVVRAMRHTDEAWISELGAFLSHRRDPLRGARLREFLNLSLRLQIENEQSAITNYTLTVLETQRLSIDDAEVIESFLLKSALISPGSMARICEVLLNLESDTKRVSKRRVASRFTTLAERNLTNGNLYEAIWQIYALRGLRVKLDSKLISELSDTTSSSALALVLLDLDSKGLCRHSLPKSNWEAAATEERVRSDWIWLLAYEGFRHGWLNDTQGLMAKSLFVPMSSRNVVFYDPRRNVRRTAKTVKFRLNARRRSAEAIAKFLLEVRGIHDDADY